MLQTYLAATDLVCFTLTGALSAIAREVTGSPLEQATFMSKSSLYQQIKERFSFDLPLEYQQMQDRGWMTLDRPATSISTIPGDGYLYLCDMEWYSLEEIVSLEFPDGYQPHLPC